LYPLRPVVLENGLQWTALNRWNPEFFKTRFGDRQISASGEVMQVSNFVDRVVEANAEQAAPYLTGTGTGNYFLDIFPELAGDIDPLPEYLAPNWLSDRYWVPYFGRRFNRGPKAESLAIECPAEAEVFEREV
jgi:hypothetical protein